MGFYTLRKNKHTDNSRNGHSKKDGARLLFGELEIDMPPEAGRCYAPARLCYLDRAGEFEPELVKKHQTDVSSTEDKVLFLYFQGVSTREIEATMREMYGIDVDDSRVSKIMSH